MAASTTIQPRRLRDLSTHTEGVMFEQLVGVPIVITAVHKAVSRTNGAYLKFTVYRWNTTEKTIEGDAMRVPCFSSIINPEWEAYIDDENTPDKVCGIDGIPAGAIFDVPYLVRVEGDKTTGYKFVDVE